MTEHELDHVFIGQYDGTINPDETEVRDFTFMKMEAIKQSMDIHNHKYTSWFTIAFPKLEEHMALKNA